MTSKYRNWAPVPGNQVWTHRKCAHIYLPCLGRNFKKMRSTRSRDSLFFSFASIPSRLKRAKGRAWAMSTEDSDFTTLLMLLFFSLSCNNIAISCSKVEIYIVRKTFCCNTSDNLLETRSTLPRVKVTKVNITWNHWLKGPFFNTHPQFMCCLVINCRIDRFIV